MSKHIMSSRNFQWLQSMLYLREGWQPHWGCLFLKELLAILLCHLDQCKLTVSRNDCQKKWGTSDYLTCCMKWPKHKAYGINFILNQRREVCHQFYDITTIRLQFGWNMVVWFKMTYFIRVRGPSYSWSQ